MQSKRPSIAQCDGADDIDIDPDLDSDELESDHNDCSENGINCISNENAVRLLLANARSLKPKTKSLRDAFSSLGLNVACITESWFKNGVDLRNYLTELEATSGIRILHKSRDGRKKGSGGGVAMAFDMSSCNFKRKDLKHIRKDFEVICAVGRVGKVGQPVAIFALYIPPSMKAADVSLLNEQLATEVAALCSSYRNPAIFVAGDMNHRDICTAVNEVGDFTPLVSGPTRGDSTIDIILSNVPELHSETITLPPLQADKGTFSDHKSVYTEAVFPKHRGYEWVVRMRPTRDPGREATFANELESYDWVAAFDGLDVDGMAEKLEEVTNRLTDKHFLLARVRKRSNESPWITRAIRWLWKKKIHLYKKGGRCQAWWDTDKKLQDKLAASRNDFMDRMLEDGSCGRSFYSATKKLASATALLTGEYRTFSAALSRK